MADDDATGELGEKGAEEDEADIEVTGAEDVGELAGARASSRVFNSAESLLCVASTEHFRHMQSLRISSRV